MNATTKCGIAGLLMLLGAWSTEAFAVGCAYVEPGHDQFDISVGIVRVRPDEASMPAGTPITDWMRKETIIACDSAAGQYPEVGLYINFWEGNGERPITVEGVPYQGFYPRTAQGNPDYPYIYIARFIDPSGQVIPIIEKNGVQTAPARLLEGDNLVAIEIRLVHSGIGRIEEGIEDNGVAVKRLVAVYDPPSTSFPIAEGQGNPGLLTVAYQAASCTWTSPTVQNVGLKSLTETTAPPAGAPWGEDSSFDISLQCPRNVNAHVLFTDKLNPANVSGNLTLAPGGAEGVDLRLFREDGVTPITFAPESVTIPTPGQFLLFNSGATGGTFNPRFTARLYRNAQAVKPGSINASAMVTMAYD